MTTRRRHNDDTTTTQRRHDDDTMTTRRQHDDDTTTTRRRHDDDMTTTRRRHDDDDTTTTRRRHDDDKTTNEPPDTRLMRLARPAQRKTFVLLPSRRLAGRVSPTINPLSFYLYDGEGNAWSADL
jgi:hypothetical protein